MSEYKIGSVNVVNGDATIVGIGTLWLAEIVAGQHFSLQGQGNPEYTVLSITDDTHIELTTTYAGDTASTQAYTIFRDYTPNYSLPILAENVVDTHRKVARIATIVDTELGVLQTNIDNGLAGKSDTTHNHDTDYSDILHDHDTEYLLSDGTDSIVGVDLDITDTVKAGTSASGAEVLSVGNGVFEDWHVDYSVMQLGGNVSFMSKGTEGVSGLLFSINNAYYDGAWKYISSDEASYTLQSAGEHRWFTAALGVADAAIVWVEVMRTDGSGNFLIGKTSADYTADGIELRGNGAMYGTRNGNTILILNRKGTDGHISDYYNDGTLAGWVAVSGATASFNSACDYRLKENEKPINDGLFRLKLLNPYRLNFINEPEKTIDSFFAHEVQSVVPLAVTGEKDAVDKDGKPEYQGVDASKLIPMMVAAMQEMAAKIEDLEAKLK